MKYLLLLLTFVITFQVNGQIAFEENFENLTTGLELTTVGYQLSQGANYTGTVTAIVGEASNNKFARMNADVNTGANMMIAKTVDVVPGKIYIYEVDSKGPFKRQLRIYSQSDELLGFSADYKPSTTAEEQQWKNLNLTFIPNPGLTKVKIGFFHYWSGTIDIDNYKVYETSRQTSYYLSSGAGKDDNPGTKSAPWKTLEKISSTTLLAGDTVLFKRGDRFDGHFVVSGSGNEIAKVLITSYGEGNKPIITGQVGAAGGGDYQEAILVENNDNLIFDGLEVQNERTVTRAGVADTDAFGLYVKNSGSKVMRNLVFRNMVYKNVYAVQPILDPADFDKIQVAALSFYSTKNTETGKEKNISDIIVENCYLANNQRFGIQFKHAGGNTGIGNDSINRNMNILIQNNEFYYNGGTGVLPNGTYNCLIENNIFDHPGASTDPRMPGRGSSIWNINAINTIMQYNMCLSTRGYLDSHGIHIDNNNVNTFVQYNYMEDCEGGFVEILMDNRNAVYRFNVSVNDGWRKNPTWADSNHTIWVNSDRWFQTDGNYRFSDGVYIYNNTCVINKPFTTSINLDGKNMFVYNNIWSSTNGAGMGVQNFAVRNNDTPYFESNNLFEGNVASGFVEMEANPKIGSPMFNGTDNSKFAYQLQAGSPAFNNGTPVTGPIVKGAGYGVFKNIPAYPNVDLYGNPIDLSSGTPNIGACNSKNGEISTGTSVINAEKESKWLVHPMLDDSKIHFIYKGSLPGTLNISLVNLKGQLVQMERKNIYPSEKEFDIDVESSVSNGIYILNIQGQGVSHSRRMVLYR